MSPQTAGSESAMLSSQIFSFCKIIQPFRNLSDLTPRKAAPSGHAAAVAHDGWFLFKNFVNDLKWRNCKHESCVSQKVMKLCSIQLFHLVPSFGALKSNLYSATYNMRKKETEYGHM
jgi:hypothetical protein